jgi:hypothetical protein
MHNGIAHGKCTIEVKRDDDPLNYIFEKGVVAIYEDDSNGTELITELSIYGVHPDKGYSMTVKRGWKEVAKVEGRPFDTTTSYFPQVHRKVEECIDRLVDANCLKVCTELSALTA